MESDALRPSVTGAAPRARTGAATYIYAFFPRARGEPHELYRARAGAAGPRARAVTHWHAAGWQRVLGTQVVALR
jgi:hypothetical protein